jgi:DNA invertase Pin-like site-specific DNA recombinase
MRTAGYVCVSTDKQAERGSSLEAQAEKIRAMALVQRAERSEIIIESGESAKSLNRPGMAKLLALLDAGIVKAAITSLRVLGIFSVGTMRKRSVLGSAQSVGCGGRI